MPDAFNPYQPPASSADPAPAPSSPATRELASRVERFGAAMIDGLIALVVMLPLQFAFHVFDGFPNIHLDFQQNLVWGAVGFAFFLALHGYFLVKNAQTVGKKVLGLQIVNYGDGAPTSAAKIIV